MTFQQRTICFVIDVALAMHLAGAALYWWFSPHGFPFDHGRFWLNTVLPLVVLIGALVGLWAMHRRNWAVAARVVLFLAVGWFAMAATTRIFFPFSFYTRWLLPLFVSVGGCACFAWLAAGQRKLYRWLIPIAAVAAILGSVAVWLEMPSAAATRPIDDEPPQRAADNNVRIDRLFHVATGAEFDARAETLAVSVGKVRIECSPLLDFDRISPDRCWSIFAPGPQRQRSITATERDSNGATIAYSDGAVVSLPRQLADGVVRLTAFTPVRHDSYSHLNTLCYIEVTGHRSASLGFSPCSHDAIEALPFDYPVGRPAQFAFMTEQSAFRVVKATSGEKGPFHTLATGELKRGEPLGISIYDDGRAVATIELADWSAQLSTDLSPTAGWGAPMNAIEFHRLGDDPSAPVGIWVTLAATSVGRGWDAVGHRAGVYRNRVTIRPATASE